MKTQKENLIIKLEKFIKKNYIDELPEAICYHKISSNAFFDREISDENVFTIDEPFNIKLFKLIDASGKTDVEIYKKAGIDRRHYSKIKSNSKYVPQKKTIIAFILALELPLKEAELLLASAGYSLSPSYLFDIIIKFFIKEGVYDVAFINKALLDRDQPLIGF